LAKRLRYNQLDMSPKSNVPVFGKIFLTSIVLSILGSAGLVFIIFTQEPTLGPRWLFFFFLTLTATGLGLPLVYLVQRRIAKQYVPAKVLIREALLIGIFTDLLLWLQIGRIATELIVLLLAAGLVLLELFLRMAEKAVFRADEYAEE